MKFVSFLTPKIIIILRLLTALSAQHIACQATYPNFYKPYDQQVDLSMNTVLTSKPLFH